MDYGMKKTSSFMIFFRKTGLILSIYVFNPLLADDVIRGFHR